MPDQVKKSDHRGAIHKNLNKENYLGISLTWFTN